MSAMETEGERGKGDIRESDLPVSADHRFGRVQSATCGGAGDQAKLGAVVTGIKRMSRLATNKLIET